MIDKMLIDTKALVGSEVFAGENPTLDTLVKIVHKAVEDFKGDTSTAKGRDEIKSMAFKVTKSKTAISDLGKEYLEPAKQALKNQGESIKAAVADLDELSKIVRKPLTDWQEEQEQIASEIDNRLEVMSFIASVSGKEPQYYIDGLAEVEAIEIDDSWGKKKIHAEFAKKNTIEAITVKLDAALKHEAAQKELEELREKTRIRDEEIAKETAERLEKERVQQEKLDKERREREEKERAEAAEKARIEREERIANEARQKAEQDAKDAEERAEQAEKRRVQDLADAKEKAEQAKKEAAERAEREKREAVEAEQKRVEGVKKAEEAEQARLAANKKHNGKIHTAAKEAFIIAGLSEQAAIQAVKAIAKDMIPNVKISY